MMTEPTDPNNPGIRSNGETSTGSAQTLPAVSPRRHWYVREIVVGIIVMVVGSYLVWALGIGTGEQRQTSPASSMHDVEATSEETIFTREIYATIQPGLTAWELEDVLGPSYLRQKLPLTTGVKELYNLPASYGESNLPNRSEGTATAAEYEEMVWQSERLIQRRIRQHIAVLLENGKVIARRQVGVE